MSGLTDLYQEVIVDHGQRPRNFHKLKDANLSAEGFNPLCGDRITIYLRLDGNVIKDIGFEGEGCAISKASSSLMTVSLKNKTKTDAKALFQKFHSMVKGEPDNSSHAIDLGKLVVLSGVKEYPVRVKCATLAWHTLLAALEAQKEVVSTE